MPNYKRDGWGIKLRDAPIEIDPDYALKTAKINNNNSWMTDWYDGLIIKDVTAKPGLKPRRDL